MDGGDIRPLLLYLDDIDEGTGPLTIIPEKESRELVKKYDYAKRQITGDQVAACVPREIWI